MLNIFPNTAVKIQILRQMLEIIFQKLLRNKKKDYWRLHHFDEYREVTNWKIIIDYFKGHSCTLLKKSLLF